MKRMSIAESTLEKQVRALREERRELETRVNFITGMIDTLVTEQCKLRSARESASERVQKELGR